MLSLSISLLLFFFLKTFGQICKPGQILFNTQVVNAEPLDLSIYSNIAICIQKCCSTTGERLTNIAIDNLFHLLFILLPRLQGYNDGNNHF